LFVDEVEITVRAGRGGDGAMAFMREKYRPMGGPAGGDGGHGGSVVLQADSGIRTLSDFRGRSILVAKPGQPGEGANKSGKSAKNLLVKVPIGTIIKDRETGEILGDLVLPGQKLIVAQGGKGGKGNARFATSTNQAPRKFEKGEPGEEKELLLELRLLADVGLVGLPNAGKSTLISSISTMKPKIADYPFTTLRPSVGLVQIGDYAAFTMADIPGLIEFASEGKGLGHQFLRHIQRTRIICHLVAFPFYEETNEERFAEMVKGYKIIRGELEAFDLGLAEKQEVVVWTKADTLPDDTLADLKDNYLERFIAETGCSLPVLIISAVRGDGISQLLRLLADRLEIDVNRPEPERVVPEYLEGEPPEPLPVHELTMEKLDESEEENKKKTGK
jgi:GTPase